VSSFLSRLRKSAARKMTINACPIFKRYRLIRGTDEEMDTSSHDSSPTGEKRPIFINVKMVRVPIENNLKNQLLPRVFASYFATVLML
jgi:hypothetical protein